MTSMEKNAVMVVFEGIDGSGKTTAGRRLAGHLADSMGSRGTVEWYPNKNLSPVRDALDAVAREKGCRDRFELIGNDAGQFLAAVLKWRDFYDLRDQYARQNHVMVLDRFTYSQLALALVRRTENEARLRRMYATFPTPDLVFYLDIEPTVALQRVDTRATDSNSIGFLERFADAYRGLIEWNTTFKIVDANRDAEVVFDEVRSIVDQFVATGSG